MSIEEVYEYWSQITIADDFKKSAYLGKSVLCKLRCSIESSFQQNIPYTTSLDINITKYVTLSFRQIQSKNVM